MNDKYIQNVMSELGYKLTITKWSDGKEHLRDEEFHQIHITDFVDSQDGGYIDIYDGNLDNNEGVCADCGEHCEMEANQ